jgi:DNA mismatch endonuclease Vsr
LRRRWDWTAVGDNHERCPGHCAIVQTSIRGQNGDKLTGLDGNSLGLRVQPFGFGSSGKRSRSNHAALSSSSTAKSAESSAPRRRTTSAGRRTALVSLGIPASLAPCVDLAASDGVSKAFIQMIVQEHPECLPRMVQRNPLERERMPDTLSPAERSARMALIRSADTELEMLVRRMGRQLGYLYRLHDSSLPGRPDLVFKAHRKAIFVHGCRRAIPNTGQKRFVRTSGWTFTALHSP